MAFTDSADAFRPRSFENRFRNDRFIVMGTLKRPNEFGSMYDREKRQYKAKEDQKRPYKTLKRPQKTLK